MDEQRLILVVEDDEATRAFLVENLTADGFRTVGASSAGEGIRAIEVRRPSLVVLDLALEGGSGLDLLDRVRHADGLASGSTLICPCLCSLGGWERRIACAASRAGRMTTFQSRRVICFPRCRAACAGCPFPPHGKARLPTGEPRARLLPSARKQVSHAALLLAVQSRTSGADGDARNHARKRRRQFQSRAGPRPFRVPD
jgi:CheY-like chemotaxis protein